MRAKGEDPRRGQTNPGCIGRRRGWWRSVCWVSVGQRLSITGERHFPVVQMGQCWDGNFWDISETYIESASAVWGGGWGVRWMLMDVCSTDFWHSPCVGPQRSKPGTRKRSPSSCSISWVPSTGQALCQLPRGNAYWVHLHYQWRNRGWIRSWQAVNR